MSLAFLRAISWGLNWLPVSLRSFVGKGIGLLWFYVVPIRRRTVIENLQEALKLSHSDAVKMARVNYQHYGRNFVEMLCSLTWSKQEYQKHVPVYGLENLRKARDQKTGGILLSCHLGNWEYGPGALVAAGLPIDIVVKRARSRFVEKFLTAYRRRTGTGILHEEGTAKDILKSLSQGRFVVFMLDQFMGAPIGLPVTFLENRLEQQRLYPLLWRRKRCRFSRRTPFETSTEMPMLLLARR